MLPDVVYVDSSMTKEKLNFPALVVIVISRSLFFTVRIYMRLKLPRCHLSFDASMISNMFSKLRQHTSSEGVGRNSSGLIRNSRLVIHTCFLRGHFFLILYISRFFYFLRTSATGSFHCCFAEPSKTGCVPFAISSERCSCFGLQVDASRNEGSLPKSIISIISRNRSAMRSS